MSGDVLFINVAAVWVKHYGDDAMGNSEGDLRVVGIRNGQIACIGPRRNCSDALSADATVVDLNGGDLTTGLVASSAALGLAEIALEPSTTDGVVADPLLANVPQILGGEQSLIRAVDGLQFGTRNAL
jgi:imidazolonepropionase-like amidohydrolase